HLGAQRHLYRGEHLAVRERRARALLERRRADRRGLGEHHAELAVAFDREQIGRAQMSREEARERAVPVAERLIVAALAQRRERLDADLEQREAAPEAVGLLDLLARHVVQ